MNNLEDITIESIGELLEFVRSLSTRYSKRLWYRGVTDFLWELLPSVQRSQKSIDNERYLTNDFYIRAKQVLATSPEKHDYAGWLTMMQHLYDAGVDLKTAMKWMGHADQTMILRIYAYLTEEREKASAASLAKTVNDMLVSQNVSQTNTASDRNQLYKGI